MQYELCQSIIVVFMSGNAMSVCELIMSWGIYMDVGCIWVRSQNCGCHVTWFCYHLIAKPGNKTAAVLWPDPYTYSLQDIARVCSIHQDLCEWFTFVKSSVVRYSSMLPISFRVISSALEQSHGCIRTCDLNMKDMGKWRTYKNQKYNF